MRHIIRLSCRTLATLATVALPLIAQAADLAPVPVSKVAAYSWSGFYIGGNVGAGWSTTTFNDANLAAGFVDPAFGAMNFNGINGCVYCNVVPGVSATTTDVNNRGGLGGFQAGLNYEIGKLVVGIEGEWDWSRQNGNGAGTAIPNANANQICTPGSCISSIADAFSINTNWMATATTRIGIASDRWLFYTKAGAAWAHSSYTQAVTGVFCPGGCAIGNGGPFPFSLTGTASETRVGWTVGLGVEWAVWNNWSVKAEYDYMNFGSKEVIFNNVAAIAGGPPNTPFPVFAAPLSVNISQQISQLSFGVNYRFAGGL